MKITYSNGCNQRLETTDFRDVVRYGEEYAGDYYTVTARLLETLCAKGLTARMLETLCAKGLLTKEELGKILNLDIVEITL